MQSIHRTRRILGACLIASATWVGAVGGKKMQTEYLYEKQGVRATATIEQTTIAHGKRRIYYRYEVRGRYFSDRYDDVSRKHAPMPGEKVEIVYLRNDPKQHRRVLEMPDPRPIARQINVGIGLAAIGLLLVL